MLEKINKIKPWQAAIIIAIVGFAVFFSGLTSPFQGDDQSQIVSNPVVHSIANIRLLFEGSTFYTGKGLVPLSGTYYRPLMATVFSLIYTVFGARPLYYHLLQLLLYIGSAVLLYLVFRYSFKPALALVLALIFLVHPLNSQVAFAIPSMQDALFFFFGILALWILLTFDSFKSLSIVALCLFLSMLSKEMGIVFVIMAIVYLFWYHKEQLRPFLVVMVLPIVLYLVLKANAVGIYGSGNNAPIDSLNLGERLLTMPSIMLFYITKFIFPWRLATSYSWVYKSFSFQHVVLPLAIDIIAVSCFVFMGILLSSKVSKAKYYTYLFFAIWAVIGIIPYLQIVPLDMTACETWFYFSMAGVLGMFGIIIESYRTRGNWLLIIVAIIVVLIGVRTAIRGLDYNNPVSLAYKSVSVSPDDYNSYNEIAVSSYYQSNYSEAALYARSSVDIYPSFEGYETLGMSLTRLADYPAAVSAYNTGLKYFSQDTLYEDRGELTLVYGAYAPNKQFLTNSLNKYPYDSLLWEYLAILEDENNDNKDAKVAISNAAQYGPVAQSLYSYIIDDQPFSGAMPNIGITIKVR
jgi:hypothetical protein